LSANTISGGGGASTGNVTFNGINIIGNDNLRFQPNATVTDGYIDVYLTVGPDIHVVASNSGNLILGPDSGANVRISGDGNVQVRAQDMSSTSTWTFNPDGNLILPLGSNIGETANATVISPPGAGAGQSLVIRPTGGGFSITTDHPDGFVPGESITITVTSDMGPGTGTVEYTITGATTEQLGRATTGTLTYTSESAQTVTWTVPAESDMTTFTFTITGGSGFVDTGGVITGGFITITLDGVVVEGGHIHLLSGNVATVDLYLGDDDQYVKIEKNAGNVVIGTIANGSSSTWKFGTDGTLTLPAVGGDEGGEIAFTKAPNSSLSGNTVVVDQFVNRFRFFEGGGGNRGAYVDLTYGADNAGTLLNNRVSGFVNAGANVIMDSLKATVTTSDQRGLSLAATTGSFTARVAGTYANTAGTGGSMTNSISITTTPSASLFGWDFVIAGDMATYIITDITNDRAYRVTMQIGNGFDNNMISIERLV
jgi:hypothetical protein